MSEEVLAARALLGTPWAPFAVSALPFLGGLWAGWCGERRIWLVAGLWSGAMGCVWGAFNPLGVVQWVVGAAGLSAAGWACRPGGAVGRTIRRRSWLVGIVIFLGAGLASRGWPKHSLPLGFAGSRELVVLALDRAEAGEVDEGIVYAGAAVALYDRDGSGPVERAEAEVVLASLFAAEGDCLAAVPHARVAHLNVSADLPKLDEAIRLCFAGQGP